MQLNYQRCKFKTHTKTKGFLMLCLEILPMLYYSLLRSQCKAFMTKTILWGLSYLL